MLVSLLLGPLLGYAIARRWTIVVGLALPVLEMWIRDGLGSETREGFENWGLVVLPLACLLTGALTAGAVALARRRRSA